MERFQENQNCGGYAMKVWWKEKCMAYHNHNGEHR